MIDNLLFLLVRTFKVAQWKEYQIMKVIDQVSNLPLFGQWTATQVAWSQFNSSEHMVQEKWDIYNSEYRAFVDPLWELLYHLQKHMWKG